MKKNKRIIHIFAITAVLVAIIGIVSCDTSNTTGIGIIDTWLAEVRGDLVGNDYYISEYDNFGNKIASTRGDKVNLGAETDSIGEVTSYIDIAIDGHKWQHVGNTMIFAQNGLEMVEGVNLPKEMIHYSNSTGLMFVDGFVNDIKNLVGKSKIIVVYSQLGLPIGVFQGDSCTITIPGDLPKMTLAMIDGKALYIHKANIDIFDVELMEEN